VELDVPPAAKPRRWRIAAAIVVVAVLAIGGWLAFQAVAQPGSPPRFYHPPAALPAGPPGTVLRDHRLPDDAGRNVWRVLYTSTDPAGHTIAVSGVVIAPGGDAPAGGWPIVAWAHGTSGVASPCAPSLYPDAGLSRIPELDALLAAGTVVAVTDYPGLGTPGPHPYLVGESEGRAVLESIRAARSLLDGHANATAAVYGHSQGGHAALFADALARSYAPELHVVGVAAMAPPTALGKLLDDDRHEVSGIILTALAIASWSRYYVDTHPATIVEPAARPIVDDVATKCITTTAEGLTDLPDVAALKIGFLSADPATAPGWSERLQENSPTTVDPTIPLLVAQGLTDDLVRPGVTEAFVGQRCAAGASIELDEYARTGHFAVRTTAAPSVADWLLARLAGAPAPRDCRTVQR
jgi:alpha-beta hydrolase superfamily lysophospholipase